MYKNQIDDATKTYIQESAQIKRGKILFIMQLKRLHSCCTYITFCYQLRKSSESVLQLQYVVSIGYLHSSYVLLHTAEATTWLGGKLGWFALFNASRLLQPIWIQKDSCLPFRHVQTELPTFFNVFKRLGAICFFHACLSRGGKRPGPGSNIENRCSVKLSIILDDNRLESGCNCPQ